MRGDEARVVEAFCDWLRAEGWEVQTEVAYVDVVGTKDDQRLYAEAKGSSPVIGIDIDIMYGQLLRRMLDPTEDARYAAVVMDDPKSVRAVLRVPEHIRQQLKIDVYTVSADGRVTKEA